MGSQTSAVTPSAHGTLLPAAPQPARTGGPRNTDPREQWLVRSLDADNDGLISRLDVERALLDAGLRLEDARLAESFAVLAELEKQHRVNDFQHPPIPVEEACAALRPAIFIIQRALQGTLVVADFPGLYADIRAIFEGSREDRSGAVATYIPQLALVGKEADRFSVALCTVDGQRLALGDARTRFSVQSTSKPITYCLALEEHGAEEVHRYVGHEPSGIEFNELALDRHNRAYNPLINAGAIICASLIGLEDKRPGTDVGAAARRGWEGRRIVGRGRLAARCHEG